jgi:gliding motility-associated-like protein
MFSSSPAEGYYEYKVVVSNPAGCSESAMVRVNIFATAPELYIPNAFTPNGDGNNDFFRLVAPGIEHVNIFRVYNRWGQIVYDSPSTHTLGWDGTRNGTQMPAGTYVWMVQAIDYTGKAHFKKGTVTLIR